MADQSRHHLKERILGEMVTEHADALERSFELAKSLLRITKSGTVELLQRTNLTNEQRIGLYLVGKQYAAKAGICPDEWVGNDELRKELGLPKGSVMYSVKVLRDQRTIETQTRGRLSVHRILASKIEDVLRVVRQEDAGREQP